MPIYEYHCELCDNLEERIHKHDEKLVEICTRCNEGTLKRIISSCFWDLKGNGWFSKTHKKYKGVKVCKDG
jgi:putative FmdB family regulatory protein